MNVGWYVFSLIFLFGGTLFGCCSQEGGTSWTSLVRLWGLEHICIWRKSSHNNITYKTPTLALLFPSICVSLLTGFIWGILATSLKETAQNTEEVWIICDNYFFIYIDSTHQQYRIQREVKAEIEFHWLHGWKLKTFCRQSPKKKCPFPE